MKPTLCLIGGCNGAGKTTLARELLPLMRIRRFLNADYLPLADEWALWDNTSSPPQRMAGSNTHRVEEISGMLNSSKTQETAPYEMSEMERLGLEAGRIATAKMLEHYKRMGIEVTPQMTLAKPVRRSEDGAEG